MRFKDLLRCPQCGGALFESGDGLDCAPCMSTYTVQALRNGGRLLSAGGGIVDRGFNERWFRHPKAQATTAGVLETKTGWGPGSLDGKQVLDAGCGCGRFSRVATDMGAHVLGVDGSPGGCRATAELGLSALHANLLDLPIRDEVFDAAFSIGVLHHTADPEAAFREVARTVKRGGELAVWVYAQPAADYLLAHAQWLHEVTRACPPEALYEACRKYAVPMRDAVSAHGLQHIAQVVQASGSLDDEECVSDTFDWHCPQYRSWHTPAEVRGWFERAGYDVVWEGDFPVSVRGRRR